MTAPTTSSGEGDPGPLTRIAEEFIRLHDTGQLTDLDEFCARYPEDQRAGVRQECEQLLRIQGVIKPHDPLAPGQTLGAYEILGPIGKGGMGEVYRARDPELDRDIAIKVLPPELACQPERVKRFKREAKAVAALDHPNIVTVYSVEESDGLHFITMQLVQGKTLTELIPTKGLSLDDFFDLAIPLADAISSAHDQGITHRDLKPANIMVTADGRLEILDFGLAKLLPQVTEERTTAIPPESLTGEGQIVGTVAYMSPEQAEGKPVDHRTDIFSLGIILYEMVTGQRPFQGETRLALMSSIMKDTPMEVTSLNPRLPNDLGRILRRALEKDRERRIQSSKDLRNELADLRTSIESGEMLAAVQSNLRKKWVWPAISSALVVALLLVVLLGGESRGPRVVDSIPLTELRGNQRWPSISPDARAFVYHDDTTGDQDIYHQRVGGTNVRNLTASSTANERYAAFDPTGTWIAFQREGGGIYVMEETGENSKFISQEGYDPAWSPHGDKLVFTTRETADPYSFGTFSPQGPGELWIVDVANPDDKSRIELSSEIDARSASWSPDGRRIAFWGQLDGRRDIWTVDVNGVDLVPVTNDVPADWAPFWSPNGDFLYFLSDRGPQRKSELWAIEIDQESGETLGMPRKVWAPPVGRVTRATVSRDGTSIVCGVELVSSHIDMAAFDPSTGQLKEDEEWELIHSEQNRLLSIMTLSPDENWLAFRKDGGDEDIFVMPAGGGEPQNMTNNRFVTRNPTWYPVLDDGKPWLTYQSNEVQGTGYQIWAVRPDGSDNQRVTPVEVNLINWVWWPDGERLSAGRQTAAGEKNYYFYDGLLGGMSSPYPPVIRADLDSSWSPNKELFAYFWGTTRGLWVDSETREGLGHSVVREDGRVYTTRDNPGNRWVDDRRLIFWDEDERVALLWDTETRLAHEIAKTGMQDVVDHRKVRFAFSKDGETLFRLRTTLNSDIYLLTLDPDSIR